MQAYNASDPPTLDAVEIATAEWVDWFNHHHLYELCGDVQPADLETTHYRRHRAQHNAELTHH